MTLETSRKCNFLIELDALLDTRLGTVRSLYSTVADELALNKEYRIRKSDDLHLIDPRIDQAAYSFAYTKRNMDVIDNSKVTLIKVYVNQLIRKLQFLLDSNNPLLVDVRIIVNHYPYEFSEEEAKLITVGITAALGLSSQIHLVSHKPSEITLDFLKEKAVFTYLLYDFHTWSTAALPDEELRGVTSFDQAGISRAENLTIIAPRIAPSQSKVDKIEKLAAETGVGGMIDNLLMLPFNLLFDFEVLQPVFFTEYTDEIAERIMTVMDKSNSPIDIEIAIAAEYYRLLNSGESTAQILARLTVKLHEIAGQLTSAVTTKPYDDQRVRRLLAEQRFVTDSIAYYVPCNPAEDFERYVDSLMSAFDVNAENSQISEEFWNRKGVRCTRSIRAIPTIGRDAYLLFVYEDCVDSDGVEHKQGSLLKSSMAFDPILDEGSKDELSRFKADLEGELWNG